MALATMAFRTKDILIGFMQEHKRSVIPSDLFEFVSFILRRYIFEPLNLKSNYTDSERAYLQDTRPYERVFSDSL